MTTRPLRVAYVSIFDPAGVMAGHRAALRAAGVEATLTLDVDYRSAGVDSAVSADVDVVVFCPGIGWGQPNDWATRPDGFPPAKGLEHTKLIEAAMLALPRAKRVAYFHGSANFLANVAQYRDFYRSRGFTLAASTLDNAVALDCAYLPPVIIGDGLAPLLTEREELVVAHTPTNPYLCSTQRFMEAAKAVGVKVIYVNGEAPSVAQAAKLRAHATFDHLRGSFSVNSLEAAVRRSVPLFRLSPGARVRLWREQIVDPPITLNGPNDIAPILTRLKDPMVTARAQIHAREWAQQFNPQAVVKRLLTFYENLP